MLLSDDIEDWILNMENFILDTCHGPRRNQNKVSPKQYHMTVSQAQV